MHDDVWKRRDDHDEWKRIFAERCFPDHENMTESEIDEELQKLACRRLRTPLRVKKPAIVK
jgi:hypothetical protein